VGNFDVNFGLSGDFLSGARSSGVNLLGILGAEGADSKDLAGGGV